MVGIPKQILERAKEISDTFKEKLHVLEKRIIAKE